MSISRLVRFRDRHQGERAVIVCNGPSLNRMDLTFLRHEVVIGLNKIHLGTERFGFYPRYLVVVNPKVAEQSSKELGVMTAVKFIGARAAEFMPEDAFIYHMPILDGPVVFSEDIVAGVHEGCTVTYAALQIAFYMGFTDVVIVGMDHRFTFTGAPHEASMLVGPDPNHFSPDYFQGRLWDNPDLRGSEVSYAVARRVFETAGRRVVDATIDGSCTVFPKVDYRSLFCAP